MAVLAHWWRTLRLVVASAGLLILWPAPSSFAQAGKPRVPGNALTREVEARLTRHANGIEAALWLGGAGGEPWFEFNSKTIRPTASAIKTFYLVELFDAYAGKLDSALPCTEAVLDDDGHPAISHFASTVRDEIRRELKGVTVRRVGEIMMGKTQLSNAVYNAAANLVTATLGGPEALSEAIRKRDAGFQDVTVRRYMLRDRTQPGDNEATASAFAILYQSLASKQLAGIDEATMTAIHEVIVRPNDRRWGSQFSKGGSLSSDPLTEVQAGWWVTSKGLLVFVIMTDQRNPGSRDREAATKALQEATHGLTELLIAAGRKAQGIE